MGKYHAYIYIAIFWSLRYAGPILFSTSASISLFFKNRLFVISSLFLLMLNFMVYAIIKKPKRILSKPIVNKGKNKKKSDFLLLVSIENIEKSSKNKSFCSQDWSFAWINTLLQEVGTFSVMDTEELRADLQRVIILPKSAGDSLTKRVIMRLQDFVKNGGILIAEKPPDKLESLSGARFGESQRAIKISSVNEKYGNYNILKKMPLFTLIYDTTPKNNQEILMSIDGKPAVLKGRYGEGFVITICFDFGLQLSAMQQGMPLDNYVVKDKTSLKDICESQDLVMDTTLEHNDYPFADILEKFILEIIEEEQPIPRLWYLKDYYTGAFIMTHDEDYFGDKMRYMVEYEKSIGVKSTFFIAPSKKMSREAADLLNGENEFAMHWDRMPFSLYSILKANSDEEKELKNQKKLLESTYNKKIVNNRNHFLKWDNHYTNTFRLLHKNGIRIDSSYGPNSGKGYLFGTSFPFHPIDTNGNIIPLLEMPFHAQEIRSGVTIDYIKKLLEENKEDYHGILILLFHPQKSLLGNKSRPVWLKSYELAKHNEQWITNFKEFGEFFNIRRNAILKSRIDNNRLSIKIDSAGQTIMFPFYFGLKKMESASVDGIKVPYTSVSIINFKYCLVKVSDGKHDLEIVYK